MAMIGLQPNCKHQTKHNLSNWLSHVANVHNISIKVHDPTNHNRVIRGHKRFQLKQPMLCHFHASGFDVHTININGHDQTITELWGHKGFQVNWQPILGHSVHTDAPAVVGAGRQSKDHDNKMAVVCEQCPRSTTASMMGGRSGFTASSLQGSHRGHDTCGLFGSGSLAP